EQRPDSLRGAITGGKAGAAVQHHHLNLFTGNPVADQRPDGIAVVRQQGAFTHAMTGRFSQLLQGITAAVGCCGTAVGERQNGKVEWKKLSRLAFAHSSFTTSVGGFICCQSSRVLVLNRVSGQGHSRLLASQKASSDFTER